MEMRWHTLARSYTFSVALGRFTETQADARRRFDESRTGWAKLQTASVGNA